ncbi:hypothetical protein SAMN04488156_102625 [Bacillus sp. 166amftsu]|nr:hypothetical protein SAMN04488156_102625 [Bacillus sp. 166amftsu]
MSYIMKKIKKKKTKINRLVLKTQVGFYVKEGLKLKIL